MKDNKLIFYHLFYGICLLVYLPFLLAFATETSDKLVFKELLHKLRNFQTGSTKIKQIL